MADKKTSGSGNRTREIISVIKKYNLIKNFKAENLRKACEELGPTFVKLGQMAAMRTDLVPEEVANEMAKLCVDVDPMPYEKVEEVLLEAYGKPVEEVFAEIDREPHGSASLAQVHYAKLQTGEEVAIKVQRLHAKESMLQDISSMETLAAKFAQTRLVKILDLKTLVRMFRQTTEEELDFLHEAQNIVQYGKNVENVPYCEAPKVYMDLCTDKVVVMERIDGPHIGDIDDLRAEGYDLSDIAAKYVANMMKQIVADGLVHFDPHQANIKVRDGKLVWLDWGMAGNFTSGERELTGKFIMAVAECDPLVLTECVILMNEGEEPVDKASLYAGTKRILGRMSLSDSKDVDVGWMIASVMKLLRQTHVVLPPKFFMTFKTFGIFQSMATTLDPDGDLGQMLTDGITKAIKDSTDSKEELEAWLQQRVKNFKKIASIPVNLADMLQNMNNNLSGFQIDMNVPEDTKDFMYGLTYFIIQGLILVSLIISSAIITAADIEPHVLGIPLLGIIGYVLALIIGLVMIFKSGRKK